MRLLDVPKGTPASKCRGSTCGMTIYWIECARAGRRNGTRRVPVDCSVPGGAEPDSLSPGRGANHFETCPDREEF